MLYGVGEKERLLVHVAPEVDNPYMNYFGVIMHSNDNTEVSLSDSDRSIPNSFHFFDIKRNGLSAKFFNEISQSIFDCFCELRIFKPKLLRLC